MGVAVKPLPLLPHDPAVDLARKADDLLGMAHDLERIAATTEGHTRARAQVMRHYILVAARHAPTATRGSK